MSMNCVIIANGDLEYTSDILNLIKGSQLIISADGGARHLRALDICPHIMIGDFDSIHPDDNAFYLEKQIKTITFPPEKNQTDSELCVEWALDHKATDITLLGVTGTRLDHTLANIFLLKKLAEKKIPARIINRNNEIHMVTDFIELKGRPGNLLSIVPVTQKVTGITLKGLLYPLVNATMEMGSCLGVSNSFKGNLASVSLEKGILIVTKSTD